MAPVTAQVEAVKGALAPWAARQMYLNFAETQHPEAPFWTGHAYQRLRQIKAAVDPHNLIRANHPLPARGPGRAGRGAGGRPARSGGAARDLRERQ